MKLPGDSDKQQGVSHEMMQRSLQSQRRVVKRVGLLEDRVDELESAEVEPGVELGDIADGAKKIAKGIGKSIGKNASLLADKAGKGLAKAGKSAATAAGKGIKSAADAGINLVGCTLLYRNGYARQHIDSEGVQTETFDEIDPTDFMKDTGKEIQLELCRGDI